MGWNYSDQSQGVYNAAMGAYNQDYYDPLYNRQVRMARAYQRGDDRKGKLTAFLNPLKISAGVRKEHAEEDLMGGMAMSPGGADLMAGAKARLGREYDRDLGNEEAGAYVQRGEALDAGVHQAYMDNQGIKQGYLGQALGAAGQGQYQEPFWKTLVKGAISGGSSIASAYAGRG